MPVNIFRAKTIILGDPGVGKTAIVQMFISDGCEFLKNYNMTFGVNLHLKRCPLPGNQDDSVEMLIYDCGGLDVYVDCLSQCWDRADATVLVYDVSAPASVESISGWARMVGLGQPGHRAPLLPMPGLVFANKTDLSHRRLVTTEAGQQLAKKLGLQYFEGSAKENVGVQEAFGWLAQQLHREAMKPDAGIRPSYSSMHKSVLRSSLSNSSLK